MLLHAAHTALPLNYNICLIPHGAAHEIVGKLAGKRIAQSCRSMPPAHEIVGKLAKELPQRCCRCHVIGRDSLDYRWMGDGSVPADPLERGHTIQCNYPLCRGQRYIVNARCRLSGPAGPYRSLRSMRPADVEHATVLCLYVPTSHLHIQPYKA